MKNRDSLMSAAAALACALGFAGVTVKYYIQWRYSLSGIHFAFGGISLCILVLCWVIFSVARYVARAQIELKTVVPLFKRLT